MADETETTVTNTVKAASDGMVKITVEKYNELLETIADQKDEIREGKDRIAEILAKPPVVNRTIVHKTAEILAQENRAWGVTFMGLGAAVFTLGMYRFRAGSTDA